MVLLIYSTEKKYYLKGEVMKYLITTLLFFSGSVFANQEIDKQFSIGLGTYATIIGYDDDNAENDEFRGYSISFAYAPTDVFAIRGSYFSLEHDDVSELESTGFDILGHFGLNMASQGFKAYIGGGLFKDELEAFSIKESFSGLQLSGGIGYNWEHVALDFILGVRDSSDYESFINNNLPVNVSATVLSGSLLLSYRF
jgi:hypothetical protein